MNIPQRIGKSANIHQLFMTMQNYLLQRYPVTNQAMNARCFKIALSENDPSQAITLRSSHLADEVKITFSHNADIFLNGEWDGLSTNPSHEEIRHFIASHLPPTAESGCYLDFTQGARKLTVKVSMLCTAWTKEVEHLLKVLMIFAGVPQDETQEDTTYLLEDEQTGKVYHASIQRHNRAGIAVVIPGFSHATNIHDASCVAWLEAYDGELLLRTYNNPDNDEPDQSIKLIPTT
jgi:hypothetical protein